MKTYRAGIDVGSTTVKLVLIDEAGHIIHGEYRRHMAHTQETLAQLLREAREKLGACQVKAKITGSGAINLGKALNIGFVQEVVAVASALRHEAPQTDVAIELGGEDAKIIYFTGGLEERMNGVCAGGTGSFIDQMASLLQTDAPGLNEQARPEMVWLTTAWKMEAARSAVVAPSLISGWISVLANTPQRAAMG